MLEDIPSRHGPYLRCKSAPSAPGKCVRAFKTPGKKGRWLLITGYASVVHGGPRTTLDMDLSLHPDLASAPRVVAALEIFGLHGRTDRVSEILA